jgi:FtsH-binding integral membrane protein
MSSVENPYRSPWGTLASQAAADERADFIRKTYLHLGGAVACFIALETLLVNAPFAPDLVQLMLGNRFSWIIVIGAFMAVSYIANSWAMSSVSVSRQYAGLALYVVAEAVVFLPLLLIAGHFGPPNVIFTAGWVTAAMFGALTLIVVVSGHDFSYLRGILGIASIAVLIIIGWACISGQNLGIPFSVAMIAFACGYILYDTSNVMKHYRIGQHVAASLALFAAVALLFWYVLQLLMQLNRR